MDNLVDRARAFAIAAHDGQTRKGEAAEPYITHVEEVATLVAGFGADEATRAAAWLHDTVEDCADVSAQTIEDAFGAKVAALVLEMSDDKDLPKAERKRLQVEHAPHKSQGAALIKVADKISNLRSVALFPPIDWDDARRLDYVDWACSVVGGLPPLPQAARAAFDEAVALARGVLDTPAA